MALMFANLFAYISTPAPASHLLYDSRTISAEHLDCSIGYLNTGAFLSAIFLGTGSPAKMTFCDIHEVRRTEHFGNCGSYLRLAGQTAGIPSLPPAVVPPPPGEVVEPEEGAGGVVCPVTAFIQPGFPPGVS